MMQTQYLIAGKLSEKQTRKNVFGFFVLYEFGMAFRKTESRIISPNDIIQRKMNKRKIDLNLLKKQCVKGRINNKSAKYETVFSFFKQKDPQARDVFRIRFPVLARELLEAIISYDTLSKLNSKDDPTLIVLGGQQPIKLDVFELKELSGEYPVKQILECLFVQKVQDERSKKDSIVLGICEQKQIHFLKKLRDSYSQFCIGDKILLEESEFLAFYEAFKAEYAKREEKGRDSDLLKLEKRIVRCLHVFTALVENSILVAIDEREKKDKAKQEQFNLQFGTKSQKKKNLKIKEQHSTCSKNSTELISNFSIKPMSQKSHEDPDLNMRQVQHSQKSMKIVTKQYEGLFEKAIIGNLVLPVESDTDSDLDENLPPKFINLLEDGVQNVVIEQAFKLANKLSRFPQIHRSYNMIMPGQMYLQNHMYGYSQGYIPMQMTHMPVSIPVHFQYSPVNDQRQQELQQMQELHQLRRSMDMFPPQYNFQMNSNIDTMSVKSRGSEAAKSITRNTNKSKK